MNENIIIVFVWPPPPPPLQQKINKTRGQSLNDDDYQSESDEHPKYNSLVDHFFL